MESKNLAAKTAEAVARTLIWGRGGRVYSYILVPSNEFLFKSSSN